MLLVRRQRTACVLIAASIAIVVTIVLSFTYELAEKEKHSRKLLTEYLKQKNAADESRREAAFTSGYASLARMGNFQYADMEAKIDECLNQDPTNWTGLHGRIYSRFASQQFAAIPELTSQSTKYQYIDVQRIAKSCFELTGDQRNLTIDELKPVIADLYRNRRTRLVPLLLYRLRGQFTVTDRIDLVRYCLSLTNPNLGNKYTIAEYSGAVHADFSDCRNLTDISVLTGLNISHLNISGTNVHDVAVVATHEIIELDISNSQAVDLDPLRGHQSLQTLVCGGTRIEDPRNLYLLPKLKELSLGAGELPGDIRGKLAGVNIIEGVR